jgi:protein CWC15
VAEAAARQEKEARDELIKSNPMLRQELGLEDDATFQVKRRWDDDVVFKNQARTEPKRQKRFVNDTVRSDFHRRFLDRYIK